MANNTCQNAKVPSAEAVERIFQLYRQPTIPPMADAELSAGMGPAASAAEQISQETPRDSCELGSIEPSFTDAEKKAAVDEFLKLDEEAYAKADELAGEYQALMQRFNDELLPCCDRVQEFLSQRGSMHIPGLPSWTAWRDRLLKNLQKKMKMSLSTFKRRLKEYQDGAHEKITAGETGEEPTDDTGTEGDPAPVVYESPKEQAIKWVVRQRKVLSGGDGPMDTDPIRDGERRIDTALQLLDEFQLALDEGLLDPIPQVAWLHSEINKRQQQSKLKVVPLHLRQANELVAKLHRHHHPIQVAKFSIGAVIDDKLVGAAICMRPACRALDDGKTIEVCRMATESPRDGNEDARNACSFLYAACARIAREMGYARIATYILEIEPGESLRGAGWTLEKTGCGGTPQGKRTNRPNGHEITPITFMKKQRWAKLLQTQENKKAVSSVPVQVTEDQADLA